MVGCKWQKHLVNKNNMLKVVNDTLSVQKVHGCREPIPIQALCRLERASTTRNVCDGNNFLEGNNLYRRNDCDDVNVSHEQRQEENANHDQCPERSGPEVGLFLFIFSLFLFGSRWFLFKSRENLVSKCPVKSDIIIDRYSIGAKGGRGESVCVSLSASTAKPCCFFCVITTVRTSSTVSKTDFAAVASSSLTSLKLDRRPSDPLRCSLLLRRGGNLTPLFDLVVMISRRVYGNNRKISSSRWGVLQACRNRDMSRLSES